MTEIHHCEDCDAGPFLGFPALRGHMGMCPAGDRDERDYSEYTSPIRGRNRVDISEGEGDTERGDA